ncbi:MAG TPA: VOC family protein [Gammaproteobacteria bacterium]|nr:VOC family protein [Gammaproteobacteria bacterium]
MLAKFFADCPSSAIEDTDDVLLATANLARAVNFYARALGFRLVDNAGRGRPRRAVMRTGRVELTLAEREAGKAASGAPGRASFVVEDFDAARERVWNLGIAAAHGGAEPHPPSSPRRFVIHDPDGHEIEVVDRRAH